MTRLYVNYIAAACSLIATLPTVVSAATLFFDNFNDRNVMDGRPVTWEVLSPFTGTADASSGDLQLAPTSESSLQAIITTVPGIVLDDVSIRAQLRIVERPAPGGGMELYARVDSTNIRAYIAGITITGHVYLHRSATGSNLAETQTDLRPMEEDVLLQFDVIGNSLSMWAWRPGEPMPSAPLIMATDSVFTQGEVGIGYYAEMNDAVLGSGAYRFVHVADTHIPEPSTIVLASLAGFALMRFMGRQKLSGRLA